MQYREVIHSHKVVIMNPISGGGLKKSIFHAVCLEMMIMDFFLRRVAQEKYQAEIRGFSSESR